MPALTSLELPAVSFFGRTLEEYTHSFALDPPALRDRAVLDVAAGPASFTAEAAARGIDAVAVDPLYGRDPPELAGKVEADCAHLLTDMRRPPHLRRGHALGSVAEAERSRRTAARRFLADFPAGRAAGRYVPGALPALPFFDRQFDLVLCAHLLFTYARLFDYEFHLAACVELVRVSCGEARIHPLVGPAGRPYPALARLRRKLAARGIASRLLVTDCECFAGTDHTLILKRNKT